jgi:hypothetical protein
VGYAIPGFVLGVALLVIFGGQLQWFPLRGLTSGNWEALSWGAKITDYLWHIALPITAMVLGSFAVTAMLTKNAFLEEIRKQYVLTARAKGLSERQVRHAQRAHPHRHRLSSRLHRRIFHRLTADRNPVFPRRPGPSKLRSRHPPRLPRRARNLVPVHPDRPGYQVNQ